MVLERDRLGAGASQVAAGMLAPVTEADFGEDELLELNLAAADGWPLFAAELAAASGLSRGSARRARSSSPPTATTPRSFTAWRTCMRALGPPSRWLGPRECRALEPGLSPRVRGAIHAPRDHQADPVATVRALAAACRGAGVDLREHVEVAELVRSGGAVTGVRTATAKSSPEPWSLRPAPGALLSRPTRRPSGRSRARSPPCARPDPAMRARRTRAHPALLHAGARGRPRGAGRDRRGARIRR